MENAETGDRGERYVVAELEQKGYRCHHDTKGSGATDIEARSNEYNLLVQVKTGTQPNAPGELSSAEIAAIKARAARLGWQAWSAKVSLDARGAMLGAIGWTKLN